MIEEIEQILADSLAFRIPGNQLHQAAVEINELVNARTLPVYLRLCTIEWALQQAMVNLATLREEAIAPQDPKSNEEEITTIHG